MKAFLLIVSICFVCFGQIIEETVQDNRNDEIARLNLRISKLEAKQADSQFGLRGTSALRSLGKYHTTMGFVSVIGGGLTILSGVALSAAFGTADDSMIFLLAGTTAVGFGVWQINIGSSLRKFGMREY